MQKTLEKIAYQIVVLFVYFIIFYDLSKYIYNDKYFVLSNLTVYIIVLTIFILIFRKTIIPDFYKFKKNYKKIIKDNFYIWLIGLVIMAISSAIIGNFVSLPENELIVRNLFNRSPLFMCILSIIIAPITEELLTRVLLKDAFKNPYIYYILSGLIFGLLHIISSKNLLYLLYLIPYSTLGFCFALMYKKTNNVWTNITFHSIHNLFAMLLLFI